MKNDVFELNNLHTKILEEIGKQFVSEVKEAQLNLITIPEYLRELGVAFVKAVNGESVKISDEVCKGFLKFFQAQANTKKKTVSLTNAMQMLDFLEKFETMEELQKYQDYLSNLYLQVAKNSHRVNKILVLTVLNFRPRISNSEIIELIDNNLSFLKNPKGKEEEDNRKKSLDGYAFSSQLILLLKKIDTEIIEQEKYSEIITHVKPRTQPLGHNVVKGYLEEPIYQVIYNLLATLIKHKVVSDQFLEKFYEAYRTAKDNVEINIVHLFLLQALEDNQTNVYREIINYETNLAACQNVENQLFGRYVQMEITQDFTYLQTNQRYIYTQLESIRATLVILDDKQELFIRIERCMRELLLKLQASENKELIKKIETILKDNNSYIMNSYKQYREWELSYFSTGALRSVYDKVNDLSENQKILFRKILAFDSFILNIPKFHKICKNFYDALGKDDFKVLSNTKDSLKVLKFYGDIERKLNDETIKIDEGIKLGYDISNEIGIIAFDKSDAISALLVKYLVGTLSFDINTLGEIKKTFYSQLQTVIQYIQALQQTLAPVKSVQNDVPAKTTFFQPASSLGNTNTQHAVSDANANQTEVEKKEEDKKADNLGMN